MFHSVHHLWVLIGLLLLYREVDSGKLADFDGSLELVVDGMDLFELDSAIAARAKHLRQYSCNSLQGPNCKLFRDSRVDQEFFQTMLEEIHKLLQDKTTNEENFQEKESPEENRESPEAQLLQFFLESFRDRMDTDPNTVSSSAKQYSNTDETDFAPKQPSDSSDPNESSAKPQVPNKNPKSNSPIH